MRIVAGESRGRRIATVEGADVRPTMDRVREAVFNSLESHDLIDDRAFVDAFAGSGALGLEALSRGAASVLFVDADRRAVATVETNLTTFGYADRATVRRGDALDALRSLREPVDVVLLDPPYAFDGWDAVFAAVEAAGVEAVVIESDRPIDPGPAWSMLKQKRYAGTVVGIARRVEDVGPQRAAPPVAEEDPTP